MILRGLSCFKCAIVIAMLCLSCSEPPAEVGTNIEILDKPVAIVTGKIVYNARIPYVKNVGFTKDVAAEIPKGYTLISATVTGQKTGVTGIPEKEPPLILLPSVEGAKIKIRVWDASGAEFGAGKTWWSQKKVSLSYTLMTMK